MARCVYTEEERAAAAIASQARRRAKYAQNIDGSRDKAHAWNRAYAFKNKRPRKVYTPEERKEAEKRWQKKYRASAKGRATVSAAQKAYLQTEAGKASQARGYQNSKKLTPEKKAAKDARLARWYATPKGKARVAANNLRRRTDGKIDPSDLAEVQKARVCYYCGVGISLLTEAKGKRYHPYRLTIDHMMPIARGGSSKLDNLVAACGECNSSKCAMTADEFFAAGLRLNGGI